MFASTSSHADLLHADIDTMTSNTTDDLLASGDEPFAVIERLADAIRTETDVRITDEDRQRLVQDLYEGPRKCQCCINWVNEVPPDVEIDSVDAGECAHPIIVRRRVMPTEGNKTRVSIHSLEICNPEARKVLFDVFKGWDNITPDVKYLVFKAPFHQFFWRWERFEKAIEDEENEVVKAVLLQIRSIVKADLAEAFAVKKELIPHGIITFKHVWTLFPPGEVVYEPDRRHFGYINKSDRSATPLGCYFVVTSSAVAANDPYYYEVVGSAVDYDGFRFGYRTHFLGVSRFKGTQKISDLNVVPARFVRDGDTKQHLCIERGKRFRDLVKKRYMAYTPDERDYALAGSDPATTKLERRMIIDMVGHPRRRNRTLGYLGPVEKLLHFTTLITQAPVDAIPVGGHRPLRTEEDVRNNRRRGRASRYDQDSGSESEYEARPRYNSPPRVIHRERVVNRPRVRSSSVSSTSSDQSGWETDDEGKQRQVLSDLHFQMCDSTLYGYDLKEKRWGIFDIDRIHEIEFNTQPFDSLVLPDGYKDLILSFVENQLKDGDTFDDIINGKGGGLVILLAGDPGVGKTLTAESVAEKIHAPLVKMELSQLTRAVVKQNEVPLPSRHGPIRVREDEQEDDLSNTFAQAARWKAVLLIDECDMYLETRNDNSPERNHVVSQFLRELEYYPSLLFLTTNREKVLDPAVYSRIHLTINYPALDKASRLAIWKTFLDREENSTVTEEEFDKLSDIDLNGRKIRNVTKTARIMAKRASRGISFEDIKNVMRITEGLSV